MQVSCNIRQQVSDFTDLYLCDSDPPPGDIRKEDSRLTKGEMFRMDFGAHSVSSIYLSITISYESFNLSGMKPDDMTST
jgi:hypothetical protein